MSHVATGMLRCSLQLRSERGDMLQGCPSAHTGPDALWGALMYVRGHGDGPDARQRLQLRLHCLQATGEALPVGGKLSLCHPDKVQIPLHDSTSRSLSSNNVLESYLLRLIMT